MTDYPELEKLKAANDALREQSQEWLLSTLEKIAAEINTTLTPPAGEGTPPPAPALQVGRQAWQFEVEKNVMVGERLGIRHQGQTLLIETGWPRLPEHGLVPDLGLARARISFSQNVMVEAVLLDELTLRRAKAGDTGRWFLLEEKKPGEEISEARLRAYVNRLRAG